MGDMFDHRDNGIMGGKWGVHYNTKVFDLEISLVQGLKGTAIIEVMIEWHDKVGVDNGSDKCGMFSGRGKQVDLVAIDWDINRQHGGDFYSMWGGSND